MLMRIANGRAPYRGDSKTRNCASRINPDRTFGISTLNADSRDADYPCIRATIEKADLVAGPPAFDKVLTIIGPKDAQSVLVQKLLQLKLTCGAIGEAARKMTDNGRKDWLDLSLATGRSRKVQVAQNLDHRGCDREHIFAPAHRTLTLRSRQCAVDQDRFRKHTRNSERYSNG
jgi:hypothetical protein